MSEDRTYKVLDWGTIEEQARASLEGDRLGAVLQASTRAEEFLERLRGNKEKAPLMAMVRDAEIQYGLPSMVVAGMVKAVQDRNDMVHHNMVPSVELAERMVSQFKNFTLVLRRKAEPTPEEVAAERERMEIRSWLNRLNEMARCRFLYPPLQSCDEPIRTAIAECERVLADESRETRSALTLSMEAHSSFNAGLQTFARHVEVIDCLIERKKMTLLRISRPTVGKAAVRRDGEVEAAKGRLPSRLGFALMSGLVASVVITVVRGWLGVGTEEDPLSLRPAFVVAFLTGLLSMASWLRARRKRSVAELDHRREASEYSPLARTAFRHVQALELRRAQLLELAPCEEWRRMCWSAGVGPSAEELVARKARLTKEATERRRRWDLAGLAWWNEPYQATSEDDVRSGIRVAEEALRQAEQASALHVGDSQNSASTAVAVGAVVGFMAWPVNCVAIGRSAILHRGPGAPTATYVWTMPVVLAVGIGIVVALVFLVSRAVVMDRTEQRIEADIAKRRKMVGELKDCLRGIEERTGRTRAKE